MADILLNPGDTGNTRQRITPIAAAAGMLMSITFNDATTAQASRTDATPASDLTQVDVQQQWIKADLGTGFTLAAASFVAQGKVYQTANGKVYRDVDPNTNVGTQVGTLEGGVMRMDTWTADQSSLVTEWKAVATPPLTGDVTPFTAYVVTFRTATSPLRPGNLQILGNMQDGTAFNLTADADGNINATRIKGKVNYQTGVVNLVGVRSAPIGGQEQVDISFLGVPGVGLVYVDLIRQETLRYNAVAYTYLPLDADLLGIDPVRLPSDGRVPIFRPGELAVVGHTATTTPQTVVNGDTISAGRTRLSRVRLLGQNNAVINTGYTENLETGVLTVVDATGWSQPVRMEHRIEDMALIRDAQIDGTVTFTRPLTHVYPEGSYISSCLRMGDLKSRMSLLFDQASWDGVSYKDAVDGSVAPGTYNIGAFPVEVANDGAFTERWVLRFATTTTVSVFGEHVGNLGTFPIGADIAPVNPITSQPYFTLRAGGWGTGWAVGNIVRMNTVGAMFPIWMVRTVQQGPEAASDYTFTTVIRGDVDNPL